MTHSHAYNRNRVSKMSARYRLSLVPLLLLYALAQNPQQPRAAAPDAPPPDVKPEDKCSVEGTVVSAATGEPLKKVHLSLRPIGQRNGVPVGTMSDSAGHFLIDNVDPGRYTFLAARNGFVSQTWSPQGRIAQNSPLTLTNGQKMTQLVFKLTPQGVITGHVVDQDGEPLSRVQVMCMRFAYQNGRRQLVPSGGTNTNDLGEYRMFDLRPGKYIISTTYQMNQMMMMGGGPQERLVGSPEAIQAAEEGYPTLYYPNTTNPEAASQIEVAAGAQIHGIDMTLVRIHTVRIKGHASVGGTARRNIDLMLAPRDSGFSVFRPMLGRSVDPKGNFEIRGVAPGSYYLTATYFEDNQRYSARMPVDVGNSNIEGLEINFRPPAEMSGRVVVEDNGDLKGAGLGVNLLPRMNQPMMGGAGGQVKDDLTFKLNNLGPDPYDVMVYGLPEGFYLKSVRLGSEDVTETGADFTRGVPAAEMVIVINPHGGQVEGTVQNSQGENAVAATVTLIPDEKHRSLNWLYKTANTDQNGHFTINGVRPGDYRIYAWEDIEPGAFQDPDYIKPHESAGQSLSIKESDHGKVELTAIPAEKAGG